MGRGRGRVSEEENGERRNPAQEWLLAFYGFLTHFFSSCHEWRSCNLLYFKTHLIRIYIFDTEMSHA